MLKNIFRIIIFGTILSMIGLKANEIIQLKDKKIVQDIKAINEDNICVALNYHRIKQPNFWFLTIGELSKSNELAKYNVYADEFKREMITLKENGAYFATLDEVIKFTKEGKFPKKCVWISFDDGERSVYDNAFPILKEMKIPFTMFIIAGQVGNNDFKNLQMSTWDELKEMRDSGLASFGSHTYDMHYLEDREAVFLNKAKVNEFKQDIIKSKKVIEDNLNIKCNTIAYPFGDTSDEVTKVVTEAGFESAFILSSNPIDSNSDLYYQNRYLIDKEAFDMAIVPWIKK